MEPQVVWAPGDSSERLCVCSVVVCGTGGEVQYVVDGPVTTPEGAREEGLEIGVDGSLPGKGG